MKIIYDKAAEFLVDTVHNTFTLFLISQLPTSGGHPQMGGYPQMDGQVERMNRTLKQMPSKVVKEKVRNWDELLGPVLFAYRTALQPLSGGIPSSLVYWSGYHFEFLPTSKFTTSARN